MLPATTRRVPEHTAESVNALIRARTEASVRHHAAYPGRIERRLRELDEEWDISARSRPTPPASACSA